MLSALGVEIVFIKCQYLISPCLLIRRHGEIRSWHLGQGVQLSWLLWYPAAALSASSAVTNVPLTPSQSETRLFKMELMGKVLPPWVSGVRGKSPEGRDWPTWLWALCGSQRPGSALGCGRALQSSFGTWSGKQNLLKVRSDSKSAGLLSSYLHLTFHFLLKVTAAFSFIYSFRVQLISFLKSWNGFLSV